MRMPEYSALIDKAWRAGMRVLAVSKPGVGKTTRAQEWCRQNNWDIVVSCLALDDPSTIRGYPFKPQGAELDAKHSLFDTVARVFRATKATLWYLDDIGQAAESTLKAVMRIVQFGELDGKKLPECVVISGATNDVGHGAGVYGMIEPLKSRFHSIIELECHVDDVVPYGIARQWPDWLLAYLRNAPDALNDWKPSKSMKIDGACPRGWEYVAQWDKIGVYDAEVWAGAVGKGRAAAAASFKELVNELPDVDQAFIDPDATPVPDNPSARFLVSMAIACKINAGNFGNAVKYLNKLPAPMRAFSIRDAFRAEGQKRKDGSLPKDYKPLSMSRDFTAWACSQDGRDVMAAAS